MFVKHQTAFRVLVMILGLMIYQAGLLSSAEPPRNLIVAAGVQDVGVVQQNWTDADAEWFYNVPQGSKLLPYTWFLHLEQPDSEKTFRDADHILALGYLARRADARGNPDGLPIGFVKDDQHLGITCAACHTGQIHHGQKAWLIDGAPALGDFENLLRRLVAALNATLHDAVKFDRFANKVLGNTAALVDRTKLREDLLAAVTLRQGYNERNLPAAGATPFGPGRVDAFGAIMNEVAVRFAQVPNNSVAADAPVSYPCLWDTPHHNVVQWNGAAENRVSTITQSLVGTVHIGALGRNSGEVLGVFGTLDASQELSLKELKGYPSSVNRENLIAIEESLRNLWSPEWPAGLPPIDPQLKAQGKQLFDGHCVDCHQPIQRDAQDRAVVAQLKDVGTDPTMAQNFLTRKAKTGVLRGRLTETLSTTPQFFGDEAPVGLMLRHLVQRAIIRPNPELLALIETEQGKVEQILAVLGDNVDFKVAGTVNIGDGKLTGRFGFGGDSGSATAQQDLAKISSLKLAFRERLHEGIRRFRTEGGESLNSRSFKLGELARNPAQPNAANPPHIELQYKARPLNGIWATAPYLHNGSIPNLDELLKSPTKRSQNKFKVGSRELDVEKVGFRTDQGIEFDPALKGNSNAGHDCKHKEGREFTDDERKQLIEYMKSL